jgi:Tfp pilus assembly protein PilE
VHSTRSALAALTLALLTAACGKKEAPAAQPGGPAAQAPLPPLTPPALAAFARAQAEGPGGSLVIDVDGLRDLVGRRADGSAPEGDLLLDFAVELLPTVVAEMKDDPSAPALARAAVLLGLVKQWAYAPEVRRLGVLAQVDPAHPDQIPDGVLVLAAVKEGEKESRELLQGLAAAIRASSGLDLLKNEQGNFCLAREAAKELPVQVCVAVQPGLFAMGTPKALASLSAAPAGPVAPPAPGTVEPLSRLVARMPGMGKVKVTIEGRGPVKVAAGVETEDPAMAQQFEAGIQAGLKALDEQADKRKAVMARALGEVKGSIEKDAEAPPKMKQAVAAATTEKLLDPRGEYDAMRKSIKVVRAEKRVDVELTISEAQVKRYARIDQGMTTVAATGILAAIAIPNFIKYQCRSKSSEGQQKLREALAAMEAKRAARGKYPDRLQQTDYRPQPGRYALCTRAGCLPPPNPKAEAACRAAMATPPAGPKAPLLCAAGAIGDGGELDVWIADRSGELRNVQSGCR